MEQQLAAFQRRMMDELIAWQIEDMHRRAPNALAAEGSVETEIVRRQAEEPKQQFQRVRTLRRRQREAGGMREQTKKPILRPRLLARMHERMIALLEILRWQ